jgi:hypothetical protein
MADALDLQQLFYAFKRAILPAEVDDQSRGFCADSEQLDQLDGRSGIERNRPLPLNCDLKRQRR